MIIYAVYDSLFFSFFLSHIHTLDIKVRRVSTNAMQQNLPENDEIMTRLLTLERENRPSDSAEEIFSHIVNLVKIGSDISCDVLNVIDGNCFFKRDNIFRVNQFVSLVLYHSFFFIFSDIKSKTSKTRSFIRREWENSIGKYAAVLKDDV